MINTIWSKKVQFYRNLFFRRRRRRRWWGLEKKEVEDEVLYQEGRRLRERGKEEWDMSLCSDRLEIILMTSKKFKMKCIQSKVSTRMTWLLNHCTNRVIISKTKLKKKKRKYKFCQHKFIFKDNMFRFFGSDEQYLKNQNQIVT